MILPLTIFIGWYVLTVVLKVSGSEQTAEGMVAKQVKTGKYKPMTNGEAPEPDDLIASIADLPTLSGIGGQ